MRTLHRSSVVLGMAAGVGVTAGAAILMGQGTTDRPPATQPSGVQPSTTPSRQPDMRMGSEFFVTGEGSKAHLWMRDGTSLRWVSSGDAGNRTTIPDRTLPDGRIPETKPGTTTPK